MLTIVYAALLLAISVATAAPRVFAQADAEESTLKASKDAAFVEALRKRAIETNERALLDDTEDYEFFLLQLNYRRIEERYALASSRTRKKLTETGENSANWERGRVASLILFLGGDPSGRKRVLKLLPQLKPDERTAMLDSLTNAFSTLDPAAAQQFNEQLRIDTDLCKLLCSYAEQNDKKVCASAAKLLIRLRPPGWEESVGKALPKMSTADFDSIEDDLADVPKLPQSWAAPAIARLADSSEPDTPLALVQSMARRGQRTERKQSARALREFLVRTRDAWEIERLPERSRAWEAVCTSAAREDLKWVETEMEREPVPSRSPLSATYTKLNPGVGVPQLLKELKDETTFTMALNALAMSLENTGNMDAITALQKAAEKRSTDADRLAICRTLHMISGPKANAAVTAILSQVDPKEGLAWSVRMGITADDALRKLYVDSGWVTAEEYTKATARTKDATDRAAVFFKVDHPESLLVSYLAGRAFVISESLFGPFRHDAVAWRLAKLSQGKLALESITEAENSEATLPVRQLSFVHGTRGYQIDLRGVETEPDLERMLLLLNRACEDGGLKERYHAIDAGPAETVLVVFGPPAAIRNLAQSRGFRLCDDPNKRFITPAG